MSGVDGSWNGNNFKNGKACVEGTYYDVAEVTDYKGKVFPLSNYFTLTR
ncbi:MAG: hypothetical protein IAF38_18440 [Bacteroidia bacterium]|nr:hypothetical protein [Bacteroidia bacterium]